MNYTTSINLLKLQAKVLTIGGEACVCIPVQRNDIFVSANEDGTAKSAYITINHWELRDGANNYGDTHLCKQSHSKAWNDAHPDKKGEPIIGNTRPLEVKQKESAQVEAPAVETTEPFDWNQEFPFPPAE